MPGSQGIPCALKGNRQVLLSATESSAVQTAPHGWRPGQVRVYWTPVLGFDCFICEVLEIFPKKRYCQGFVSGRGILKYLGVYSQMKCILLKSWNLYCSVECKPDLEAEPAWRAQNLICDKICSRGNLRINWAETGQLSMTETRKRMSGWPGAKLLIGLVSPNQMDGQGDRQLFTHWTASQVLSESFAWLLGGPWSGVEGGVKSWMCCSWGTAHLAVSMCLWKIWLEMDTAADRAASTPKFHSFERMGTKIICCGDRSILSLVYFFLSLSFVWWIL